MFNNKEVLLENDDDGEEDVVIAGSELYEALFRMGYSDYEIVPASNGKSSAGTNIDKLNAKDSISRLLGEKILRLYRHLMKDSRTVRTRLTVISEAEHLLDDHAALIENLLDEEGCHMQYRAMEKTVTYLQYAAGAAALFCFVNRPNPLGSLLVLPALIAGRCKYAKYRTNLDLRKLLYEQTELHYVYKKGLRILKQFFATKNGIKRPGTTKFVDLTAEKLIFLQPVTEMTLRSLQVLSKAYYRTTLSLASILPDSCRRIIDSQITHFDPANFLITGEITYETLKQSFYRFILIQSEMLLTLAVFSNSESHGLFKEIKWIIKAEKIIEKLLELTTSQRILMGKIIDDFHNYKLAAVEDNKYRGFRGSKWQDLYVRLYLTSHKMQNAYNTLSSVLEDIETHLDRRTDETELLKKLKIRLDEVCGDAEKARDLAQLSALIISKMERVNSGKEEKDGEMQGDPSAQNCRLDLPIVRDSDPEIVDEVFEEYIRERYSEVCLNEDGDDYLESSYKLDRLLSKNLMSELKEVLIDKEKDTKERETRALERMGNRNAREVIGDDETRKPVSNPDSEAETEPINSVILPASESQEQTESRESTCPPQPPPLPMKRDLNRLRREEKDERTLGNDKEKEKIIDHQIANCFIPSPNSAPISLSMFLSNNEETFIGSGENSDEELVDVDESLEDNKESSSSSSSSQT